MWIQIYCTVLNCLPYCLVVYASATIFRIFVWINFFELVSMAAPGFIQRLAAILPWEQGDGNLLPDLGLITIPGRVQPRPKYGLNKDDIWKQLRSTVCGWVNGIKWYGWSRFQSLKFSKVTAQKSSAWGGVELRFCPWVLFFELLSRWEFLSFSVSSLCISLMANRREGACFEQIAFSLPYCDTQMRMTT